MTHPSLPAKPIRRRTLADQLAEDIADRILSGALAPGDSLPAGPELAQQYGVSRAVVRDATNLLAARGLVDVRHGSGVYVTSSQHDAFGNALLLSLRRAGATAWDVEQFEQLLFPAVAALVCANATEAEIAAIRDLADRHLESLQAKIDATAGDEHNADLQDEILPFARILQAIFDATHNEVARQIGAQLTALRRPRNWIGLSEREGLEMDRAFVNELLAILETHDPQSARQRIDALMQLPPEAVEAMKQTPIGDITRIDIKSILEDRASPA